MSKAPKKIYVKEFDEGISQTWSSTKAKKTTAIIQHEYIHKDTLMEKLKKSPHYTRNAVMKENLYGRICAASRKLLTY